jgi:hypothetical protein
MRALETSSATSERDLVNHVGQMNQISVYMMMAGTSTLALMVLCGRMLPPLT